MQTTNKLTAEEKRKQLIEIGFEEIQHYTIGGSIILYLGRNRHLSISYLGTPNEMMFIGEVDQKDKNKVTDLICLHNWNYDKELTIEKVQTLISFFSHFPSQFKDQSKEPLKPLSEPDGWIDVKDRLPEHDQEILCLNGSKKVVMATFNKFDEQYPFKVQKYVSQGERSFSSRWAGVTHWMPLPSHPNK